MAGGDSLAAWSGTGVGCCPAPVATGLASVGDSAGMVAVVVDGAATVADDRGVAGGWVAVGAAETPQAIPAAKTQAPKGAKHQRRVGGPWQAYRVP